MHELSPEAVQAAISKAFKMWRDQKSFSGFRTAVNDEEKTDIRYRLRGKSHEFAFPAPYFIMRREIRPLKAWWEAQQKKGAILLPVQQKSPGVFGVNAFYKATASGSIFNFEVPVQSR